MSAVFIRKHLNMRNVRKFLLYSLSHDSSLRVTIPRMHRVVRHKSSLAVAHNYKHFENSNLGEKAVVSDTKASNVAAVDQALEEANYNVQRIGRVHRKEIEEIYSMVVDLGHLSTRTHSLYLIRCCGLLLKEFPQDRVKMADKIWNKLQELGCKYDISHYNALLKVYVDSNHQFLPTDFLALLESNNVLPNKVTFLHLMKKYCNDGDLNGASEILEYMKEKGLPISENVFNVLITGHMNANDVSGAKDIFDVMKSSNLKPGAESYTALACAYAKNGDIDAIKSVFQDAQNNGVVLSNHNYLAILSSLSSDEHLEFVDQVITMMGFDIQSWKHGVLNTVVELVFKNACESAFKLVSSVTDGGEGGKYNTNIFLGQLIKTGQPLEKILHYCDEIYSKGYNPNIYLNSANYAREFEKFDYTAALCKAMLKTNLPLRSNHFWPMFTSRSSEEGILSTLKLMYDRGIPADVTLYYQYVLPLIDTTDPKAVLTKIQETGQTKITLIDALFQFYCYHGDAQKALYLIENESLPRIPIDFKLETYFAAHSADVKKNSQSAFHKVLAYVMRSFPNYGKNCDVIRGKHLASLILLNPSAFLTWLKHSEGFEANDKCLNACYKIVEEKNPKMLVHLRKLDTFGQRMQMKTMTIEEEDRELEVLKKKGVKVDSFLQKLLQFHIKEKNIDRVYHLKAEVDNLGTVYSPFTYCQLFQFHLNVQVDVEMAGKYLKALKENYPEFTLDTTQILSFVVMLIKYSKFEEATDVIKTHCKSLKITGSKDFLLRVIRRTFEAAMDTGDMDLVKNVQSSLQHFSNDISPKKLFFEPLIKMHLFGKDLDAAVEEFKLIAQNNQVVPCMNLLMKTCIIADDSFKLDTVIDAASKVLGRITVLHELIWAFFEAGHKNQALQVIEHLGDKLESGFFENVCSLLYKSNYATDLLEFLTMIRGLKNVDHPKLFSYLFKLYDNRNEFKQALNLYDMIEKQQLFIVDDKTKNLLVSLLRRNNEVVPDALLVKSNNDSSPEKSVIENISDQSLNEFHDSLEKGDALQVLNNLESMKKGHLHSLSVYEMTKVISLLLEKKLFSSLSNNINAMSYIIENSHDILYPLLNRYADSGNIESLSQVSNVLPDFCLKKISMNGYISKAYLASGKHKELLTEMENRWDKKNKMFSAIAFLELVKHPDLQERAINLAKKFQTVNFSTPIAIVWAYYLSNENYDKAKEYEMQYSVPFDKADSIILRAIKQKESITMARLYVDKINQGIRLRNKERAYGALLDLLVLKGMYSEAADLINEANGKGVNLSYHYRSTLISLKSALERENKPVPFTIPNETTIISEENIH